MIEKLDITISEQKHLKTIIGTEVKYDRRRVKDNKAKKAKRRNESGLTSREQQKQDLIKRINKLIIKGLNNKQIAEKLDISVRQVQRYKKNL